MIVIVMGVSGAGKSTVGRALAAALGWPFVDADDLHPPANIEKMRRGEPLDDADRAPWLDAVAARIAALNDGVFACSALHESYRARLQVRDDLRFVFLVVPRAVLRQRLLERHGHFMPASLLDSQLQTLEPPHDALAVDGDAPIDEIVAKIRAAIGY
jgi:gluconokinase